MNRKELTDLLAIEMNFDLNPLKRIWEAVLWWWLPVFFIMFFVRPFGLSDSNRLYLFYECLGFSLTTFIPLVINLLFIKNVLYRFVGKKWYIHHELLFYLLVFPQVSFLNFLFSSLVVSEFTFTGRSFFQMAAYTAMLFIPIAIFKTIIGVVSRYNKEVVMLNTKIEYFRMIGDLKGLSADPINSIELFFDNDSLQIARNKIMLITAWGNYIKVMVQTNNKPVEVVKRGRIKEIEEQLISYPEFMRCHRSYILNVSFIKNITGNVKKSDAILRDREMRIPIARGNIKAIRESIEKERLQG